MKTYTTEVYEISEYMDLKFNLPYAIVKELKLVEGDSIVWTDNNDGSFTLRKEE
ncbi:MAG: hypothetical protein HOK52_06725 [Candidatus Marinimicrobia bacterium]|jgi:hypothetical protein|nr:hypothetical protein [Candidatus Neomarinimicrobiota bacterium]